MKTKADPRFEARLAKAAEFPRPILQHLRALVRAECPEAVETIKWGHLAFTSHGKLLCMMGSFTAHCTFGFWHQDMKQVLAKDLGKMGTAMGLMGRITAMRDLPGDKLMRGYIRHAVKLNAAGVVSRRPTKPKAAIPVPADLVAALKKNKAATAAWGSFSPSAKREYLEWITEAKREETREKRLLTTMEWLAEGKRRNWAYENC